MKVLQINCVYDYGSTGKITRDIHKNLQKNGFDSVVLYGRRQKVQEAGVYKTCTEFEAKAWNVLSRLTGQPYAVTPFGTLTLLHRLEREKPDVVHLQCINGYFVDIYRLLNYLKKNHIPTVLTLHAEFKLCVLKKLSCMKYESICYMDTDVYIQGSFDAIWTECRQNIMLYDINHGLNTRDYVLLCDEIESYCGQRKLITHYGGEFFAASAENAKAFVDTCEQVYYEMLQKNFITTKGDEFILSLAANEMRESIKNAGAYIYRFWTGAGFRLISTCYEYNRITILHLPAEKEQGMLKIYDKYIKIGKIPVDEKVWKTFRLNRIPFLDKIKKMLRNTIMKK